MDGAEGRQRGERLRRTLSTSVECDDARNVVTVGPGTYVENVEDKARERKRAVAGRRLRVHFYSEFRSTLFIISFALVIKCELRRKINIFSSPILAVLALKFSILHPKKDRGKGVGRIYYTRALF